MDHPNIKDFEAAIKEMATSSDYTKYSDTPNSNDHIHVTSKLARIKEALLELAQKIVSAADLVEAGKKQTFDDGFGWKKPVGDAENQVINLLRESRYALTGVKSELRQLLESPKGHAASPEDEALTFTDLEAAPPKPSKTLSLNTKSDLSVASKTLDGKKMRHLHEAQKMMNHESPAMTEKQIRAIEFLKGN